MHKNTRAYRLYALGAAVAPGVFPEYIMAMAVMIDEATKSKARAKREEIYTGKIAPFRAWEILRDTGAGRILCNKKPSARLLGSIKRQVLALNLDAPDITTIAQFVAEGGWYGSAPTATAVVNNFESLLAKARSDEHVPMRGPELEHL